MIQYGSLAPVRDDDMMATMREHTTLDHFLSARSSPILKSALSATSCAPPAKLAGLPLQLGIPSAMG
jgi:hypothetical protein